MGGCARCETKAYEAYARLHGAIVHGRVPDPQRPGAPLGYDDATEQERAEIIESTITQPSQGSK